MALETLIALKRKLVDEELKDFKVKRASVAAIFRILDQQGVSGNDGLGKEIHEGFEGFAKRSNGRLQVLFIKRAFHIKDIHSGQIAFPGGKVDDGEGSKQAAIRETMEEIGVDLTKNFKYLGRTQENNVYQHFRKRQLFVCCHGNPQTVFLQHDTAELELTLNPKEVQKAFWVDFSIFTHNLQSKSNQAQEAKWTSNSKSSH